MTSWYRELKELEKLYDSFKDQLPDLEKELKQLIRTEDSNVVMLYSRRCLEVIVTDLCETKLKRPRKTQPLKGIIDKLNSEEIVPSNIITSMDHLNSLSTYGTHPKDFDPEQVKPVLNNLAIVIRWFLKYNNIQFISNTKEEERQIASKETQAGTEEQIGKVKTIEVKKHNLPISTTSFVGREKEMKEVRDLFQKSRLVTLTGAGGCGKTRLAREIAFTLVDEYRDGVWFVDLAPIIDLKFVTKAITEVLSIKEEPDRQIIDTLIDKIKDKSLLILLDNCEHLLQTCAETADKLLKTVKGIRILATSRETLNIQGEVVWIIPSLSFPAHGSKVLIDEADRYESIRLFTDRAALGKSGFSVNTQNISTIAQICSRIEGIPLAIELAATRIRHLGPETILERLEDQFKILSSSSRIAPERQQTLKATIDWSYNLLSEQEQLLFNRLAVFASDFSLDAAEEICSDNKLTKENILSFLSQLVDKSLVIAIQQEDESIRYRYLEPIRQYSLQKLIENEGEDKFRNKHLEYYLKMAERAYKGQFDAMAYWMTKLSKEHDNLISALGWADQHSSDEYRLLAGTLGWFWNFIGYYKSGIDYMVNSLEKRKDRTLTTARILTGLGNLASFKEGYTKGYEQLNESLEIFREIGDIWGQAIALYSMAIVAYGIHNEELGQKYSEEALKLATETGDKKLVLQCLIFVCQGLVCNIQIDQAKTMVEKLHKLSKEVDYPLGIMAAGHFLGDCAALSGCFKEAEKSYGPGIKEALNIGFAYGAIIEMQGVAISVAGQSRYSKAVRLNTAALEQAGLFGLDIPGYKFWQDLIRKHLEPIREKIGEELYSKYEEEGRKMGFEAAIEYALDFDKD